MPRPTGWSAEDESLRDACVRALEPKEDGVKSAYAVCTAMVEKHRRDGNPADVVKAAKDLWKRLLEFAPHNPFDLTEENLPHIKAQAKTGEAVWLRINGKDAVIPPRKVGPGWLERATLEDFRRIAVY